MPVLLSYMIRPATFVRKAATPKLETHMMDGNDLPNLGETSVCIRCRKHDALDYPAGHGGQLCGGCEDLQEREYVHWEAEQRARAAAAAAEGRPRAINQRRGF